MSEKCKKFIERDELKEIEEELFKIRKESKDMDNNCWLYCLIYQRYIALQKKKFKLLETINKITWDNMKQYCL